MTKNLFRIGALGLGLASMAQAQNEADAIDKSLMSPKTTAKGLADRFTFGSYGELHARVGDGDDNIDLHRLVLLANIQITDNVRFVSETEFEHALFDGEGDAEEDLEKELEQAYFEFTVSDDLLINAGVQILPIGIVNPRHEPVFFYGVERPNVEKYTIPSTWRETSVSAVKKFEGGLEVTAMVHAGLDTETGDIRSGRPENKDYLRGPESYAATVAARYTGIAGVELGGAIQYQDDISSSFSGDQTAILVEAHGIYRQGGFEFRALGAYWDADDFGGYDVDGQWGAYIEPSYKFDTPCGDLGVFVRGSYYDYLSGTSRKDVAEYSLGFNYWPTEETVIKFDYTNAEKGDINDETFNFGLGYYF